MKKIINYMLLIVLMFSFVPVQSASAATPSFFFPDDGELRATANMAISTAATAPDLNRGSAKISNAGTISIGGTFQQVTGTTLSLTVEQIALEGNTGSKLWVAQPGKTAVTSVGATNNRFQVSGVELFQGYNRLTFSGTQGSAVKKEVFYVLYDSAPLIKQLQITSNNQNFDLNESASLVVTSSVAFIQGSAENVKSVTINGQNASVLDNGLFYGPATNLQPGLNNFDIVLGNETDSVTVKRQLYYYDDESPFTIVEATQAPNADGSGIAVTQSLLGTTPTFTGLHDRAALNLQFLAPYQADSFNGNATIAINVLPPQAIAGATETVITNTYGAPAFKLVNVTVPASYYTLEATLGVPNAYQPVNIAINYTPPTGTPLTIIDKFEFNLASGKTLIKNAILLPNYNGIATITNDTVSVPLSGTEVRSPDFYVLVEATQDLLPDELKVALQPLGNAVITVEGTIDDGNPATPNGITKVTGNTTNNGQLFKISGLPEGAQTIAFSVNTDPVSYTAKVTHVSKLYIELDNLYEGQVFTINSAVPSTAIVPLSGKMIGFENRLKVGTQLIINNSDKSALIIEPTTSVNADGSYNITLADAINQLAVGDSKPLFTGENSIQIIAYYTDGSPTGTLRKYIKEIKFFIVDSNAPDIGDIRPLTPPTTARVALSDPVKSKFLPPSPELQLINGAYVTTLTKFDLYIEGSGADTIEVRDGATQIFTMDPSGAVPPPNAYYASADFYGNRNGFKIRLNDVLIPVGTHAYTIVLTNTSGANVTQTLTVQSQNVPFRLLSPVANTGDKIYVNKNFVLFDVEAEGATDVQINGNSAKPRSDIANRYTYTLTGLKGDTENKISLVVKRSGGDIKETVNVTYVTSPAAGSMYMEPMTDKHSAFDKALQLSFPKGNVLRRELDGKVQPKVNLLFGIADPENGNTELVNDYNQKLGTDIDSRTPSTPSQTTIPISSSLSSQFSAQLGREHFTRVSDYYWISAGMGELSKVGASDYKPVTGGLAPYSTEGTFTRYDDRRKLVPSERGTLTLKYEDSVVDQAAAEVTVFFLNDEGDWKNIGGTVDTKAHTVTVPFDEFGYYMVGKLKYGYDDISNHEWARDILQALFAKGYMPAIYNNQFGAGDNVTRGEFAGLMVRSLGMRINADDNNTFIDIIEGTNSATWTYEEIETAARAGIVQGYDDLYFGADLEITRQDAAVMISRAMNLKLAMNDEKLKAKVEKAFADSDKINTYARPAVDALSSAKVMVGSPVISPIPTKEKPLINFNPLTKMTRAEAAQIAVRLLQKYVKGSLPANLS
jgi:hypothetical protein